MWRPPIRRMIAEILENQARTRHMMERMMATLDDVRSAVAAERTVVDSVVTLLTDLSKRLADAITANDPAAIQAIVDDMNKQKDDLAAAVAANTPAAAP